MHATYLLSALAGLSLVAAAPTASAQVKRDAAPKTAAELILAVIPNSKTCDSKSTECRTADQAAQPIIDGMYKYGVMTYAEIAGLLSLMGFESVDFQYKHNVSPGRPGQGTVNMQMLEFNTQYATELFGADKVKGLAPNDVLALVTPDEYNFASAAWYYKTKCSDSVKTALKAGNDAGFNAYMGCVGVTVDSGRQAYWTRAKQAFGL